MSSVNTFSPAVRATAKKVLPAGVQRLLGTLVHRFAHWSAVIRLALLRRRMMNRKPGSIVTFNQYKVRINDGPNFYYLYKDIFENRVYHFDAWRSDPLIVDCGSNIGMSVLYYKQEHPLARIIAFEPDPAIFRYLQENII